MSNGLARSLTVLGPAVRLSTIARRVGSASAWNTRSTAALFSIGLSIDAARQELSSVGFSIVGDGARGVVEQAPAW